MASLFLLSYFFLLVKNWLSLWRAFGTLCLVKFLQTPLRPLMLSSEQGKIRRDLDFEFSLLLRYSWTSDMKRTTLPIWFLSPESRPFPPPCQLLPPWHDRSVTIRARSVGSILFHNVALAWRLRAGGVANLEGKTVTAHPLTVVKVNNKLTAHTDLQTKWGGGTGGNYKYHQTH